MQLRGLAACLAERATNRSPAGWRRPRCIAAPARAWSPTAPAPSV